MNNLLEGLDDSEEEEEIQTMTLGPSEPVVNTKMVVEEEAAPIGLVKRKKKK